MKNKRMFRFGNHILTLMEAWLKSIAKSKGYKIGRDHANGELIGYGNNLIEVASNGRIITIGVTKKGRITLYDAERDDIIKLDKRLSLDELVHELDEAFRQQEVAETSA